MNSLLSADRAKIHLVYLEVSPIKKWMSGEALVVYVWLLDSRRPWTCWHSDKSWTPKIEGNVFLLKIILRDGLQGRWNELQELCLDQSTSNVNIFASTLSLFDKIISHSYFRTTFTYIVEKYWWINYFYLFCRKVLMSELFWLILYKSIDE